MDLIHKKIGAPFKILPEQLEQKVIEYKEWAKNQVFEKVIFDPKSGEQKTIELKCPLTIQQFCLYVGMSYRMFKYYLNKDFTSVANEYSNEINEQLCTILTHVHEYIQNSQLSGAILNEYNANIVSRINGLNDTIYIQQNVSINPLPVHINNSIIDLTSAEYTVINDVNANKLIELSENTLTE